MGDSYRPPRRSRSRSRSPQRHGERRRHDLDQPPREYYTDSQNTLYNRRYDERYSSRHYTDHCHGRPGPRDLSYDDEDADSSGGLRQFHYRRLQDPDFKETALSNRVPLPPYEGVKDVDPDQRPIYLLLIRGLKSNITEERFAKDLEKLYRDIKETNDGAKPNSLKRVMLIRDRRRHEPTAVGYAEYFKTEDAKAARERALKLGDRCTISSTVVHVDFPHDGVFPHADFDGPNNAPPTEFTFDIKGKPHKYHDNRYYASVFVVNENSPHTQDPPASTGQDTKTDSTTGKKRAPDTLDNQPKKRKVPAGKGIAALQNWQTKQAELRGTEESVVEVSDEQTFAYDGGESKKICYLCNTRLDTSEKLLRHTRESTLHLKNMKIDEARTKGYQRLKSAGIAESATLKLPAATTTDLPAPAPVYHDRAAERRDEQTKAGVAAGDRISLVGLGKKKEKPAVIAYGKGAAILGRMGGPGAQIGGSGGIATPIETGMYAAGVGLGHEGSRIGDAVEEARKATEGGRGAWTETAQQRLRDRAKREL